MVEISLSVVVYESEMYLRLHFGSDAIDLPMDEAEKLRREINRLVPYRLGQRVWTQPQIKFVGEWATVPASSQAVPGSTPFRPESGCVAPDG